MRDFRKKGKGRKGSVNIPSLMSPCHAYEHELDDEELRRVMDEAKRRSEQKPARLIPELPMGTPLKVYKTGTEEQQRSFSERVQEMAAAQAETERRERVDTLMAESNIPRHYREATLDTLPQGPEDYVRVVGVLRSLLVGHAMIALVGPRGGGKTTLGCAVLKTFCEMERSAVYIRFMYLTLKLKAANQRWSGPTQLEMLGRLARQRMLVLDEVCVTSEWERRHLAYLVDSRYSEDLPILLISNLDAESFRRGVGDSVSSRMRERGGIVECTWPSFRGTSRVGAA